MKQPLRPPTPPDPKGKGKEYSTVWNRGINDCRNMGIIFLSIVSSNGIALVDQLSTMTSSFDTDVMAQGGTVDVRIVFSFSCSTSCEQKMISALSWVKKGAALSTPERLELSDEEYERIQKEMGVQLMDAQNELLIEETTRGEEEEEGDSETEEMDQDGIIIEEQEKAPGDLSVYDLDNYDNDDESTTIQEPTAAPMFSNIRGLSFHQNSADDPYIQLKGNESEDELEELLIENTDNLILACKTEDDISHLEVYVYEEQEDNLYVHHDIMLPSFPLCLEWIDFPMGRKAGNESRPFGNYVAIGTFDPQVEIWDLDVIDAVFPEVILGQIPSADAGIKSGKSKHGPARVAKRPQAERHVDAVMTISANRTVRNLIATGSADTTIKLWDLNSPQTAVSSYSHHKNKVQAVVWNPQESSVLLSGGYDKLAAAFDSRAPNSVTFFKLTADVECMKWDPFRPEVFYVSTEDGLVKAFDVRNPKSNAIFTLQAHDSAVSALDINPFFPGCMVTGSGDKTVKIWSLESNKPKCLLSKDLNAGKVFSTTFSMDSPGTVAIAGSRGKVIIWNLESNSHFKRGFPNRQFGESSTRKEVMEMESDEEIEEEDEQMDSAEEV